MGGLEVLIGDQQDLHFLAGFDTGHVLAFFVQ